MSKLSLNAYNFPMAKPFLFEFLFFLLTVNEMVYSFTKSSCTYM